MFYYCKHTFKYKYIYIQCINLLNCLINWVLTCLHILVLGTRYTYVIEDTISFKPYQRIPFACPTSLYGNIIQHDLPDKLQKSFYSWRQGPYICYIEDVKCMFTTMLFRNGLFTLENYLIGIKWPYEKNLTDFL